MHNSRPKRSLWKYAVFGVLLLLLGWLLFAPDDPNVKGVTYSQYMAEVDGGTVKKAFVSEAGRRLEAELDGGGKISASYVREENIAERLRAKGIDVDVRASDEGGFGSVLAGILPILLILLVLIVVFGFLLKRAGPGGQVMQFTANKARRFNSQQVSTRFSDVLGADQAVEMVREMVAYLCNPRRFTDRGAEPPQTALFTGPEGTGKTLLARAIAGEAGVPFFSISGSDFVEMFVGVGASRVRALMEEARKAGKCIVFIDEIDAVGRHRGRGVGNSNDEREQTLNQLLVEIEGFSPDSGVMLIAATNRPDVLDRALMSRFKRKIEVPNPDMPGRLAILEHYLRVVVIDRDVNLSAVAAMTAGFSGRHLKDLVNEAILSSIRQDRDSVEQIDFEVALERLLMGSERTLLMSSQEKRRLAVHETGHTILALANECEDDMFHKVTIIPRGRALGASVSLPVRDRLMRTESQLLADVDVLLGARAAEILVFGESSTGAANDLERATDIMREMIASLGMSREFGPVSFATRSANPFGHDPSERPSASEMTQYEIEQLVKKWANDRHDKVTGMLTKRRKAFDAVIEALILYETLTRKQVLEIIARVEVPESAAIT